MNPAGGTASALAPFAQITTIDPHLSTPYSQQFSLTVEREMPKAIFASVSFVGNLGRHLLREPDINIQPFDLLAANNALPTAQRVSTNALRPYKGFAAIRQYTSDSTSNYYALQSYLSRRKGPVSGTVSYTWSKALADASGNGDNPENYQDRHFNYGPTTYDRRQALVTTMTLTLPSLSQYNAFVKGAAGGWEVSGIIRLQSGQHLTPTASTSTTTRRTDYIGGVIELDSDARSVNAWLSKAALAAAPNNRYGNAGVGIISGPGKQMVDISLRKYFSMTERIKLRVQADFFNIANIANFGNPNVVLSDVNYGTISSADPGRNIQLGLKVTF